MKYFLIIFIIVLFGAVGYARKRKIVYQINVVQDIIKFIEFYESNLSVFKNNLIEIFNKYIIMQNNKNAINNIIILKNNNIFEINQESLKKEFDNIQEKDVLMAYFFKLGQGEFDDEKIKNKEMKNSLKSLLEKLTLDKKMKGDLFFKIMLAIGCVISILIWWLYGSFCFI